MTDEVGLKWDWVEEDISFSIFIKYEMKYKIRG